jgi:YVTN family beta-propeller protein
MLKFQVCSRTHFSQSVRKWSLILTLTLCQIMTAVIITTAQKRIKPLRARSRAYVVNSSFGSPPSISVIDVSTNAVSSNIPLDVPATGIVIDWTGTRLFVYQADNVVVVIDTATNAITARIALPMDSSFPASPLAIAISPDGSRVYVTYSDFRGENRLAVIDTTMNTVIARLTVGPEPRAIAVNPAGTLVFVAHSTTPDCNCALTVIDATNNTVLNIAGVRELTGSVGLIVSKDNKLYASSNGFGVRVVDVSNLSNLTVINKIIVGFRPQHAVFDQGEAHLFVASSDSNSLSIVDLSTGAVEAIHVGVGPKSVAIDSSGKFAYVVNFTGNSVSVVDLRTRTVIKNIGVGELPVGIVITQ